MIIHAGSHGKQTQNGQIVTVGSTRRRSPVRATKETNVPRYSVETIEAMQKHLLGYRDNLRVEVELGIPIVARTVAELRTLPTWPGPLGLDVHIDLDPRLSVMTVRGAP